MAEFVLAEASRDLDVFDLAYKTNHKIELSDVETDNTTQLDAYFKKVGTTGADPNCEIAAFIQRAVNTELYDAPDELLDMLFDRNDIGFNDDFQLVRDPENTLIAYEAAHGGNVERSYLDISSAAPAWKNRQIESEISYSDLKRNGWKTVALLTEYATDEFKKCMFADIFSALDGAITSGANYLASSNATPSQADMDWISLYIADKATNGDGNIVSTSKYIQAASKLTGFTSSEIINEVHRNGFLGEYDGIPMHRIAGGKTTGNGTAIFPAKTMFGIAGKIGTLGMKGSVDVYQVSDPNKEIVHILFKNFTYGWAFTKENLENVAKIVFQ